MQTDNSNKWLDEVRDAMLDYQAEVPANGWDRVASVVPHSSNRWQAWQWLTVAASILLCVVIGGGYFMYNSMGEENAPKVLSKHVVKKSVEEPPFMVLQNRSVTDHPVLCLEKRSKHLSDSSVDVGAQMTDTMSVVATVANTNEERHENVNETQTLQAMDDQRQGTDIRDDDLLRPVTPNVTAASHAKNKKTSRWMFGLNIGGHGMLASTSTNNFSGIMDAPEGGGIGGTNSPVGPDEVKESGKHTSLSFGLSVEKEIFLHSFLETGVVYTLLTSDVKKSISGSLSQKIHYLGVPLRLNYQVFTSKTFQLYTGAGIMLEHSLDASRGREHISVKPWQWSTNITVGGQARLTDRMYLYLEPGVSWYINAQDDSPSIRTESPVYFHLRAGLRLSY